MSSRKNRQIKQSKELKKIKVNCTICNSDDYDIIAKGPDFEYRCSDEDFCMVKCHKCGMIYLNPRPSPEELSTIYPPDYIPYRFNKYLGSFMAKLRDFVQSKKIDAIKKYAPSEGLIVDVGCGGGYLLNLAKKFGDRSWRLLGIDISTEAIEYVRARGIQGICGQFETLELPKNTADMVIMNQVIEHLDDPRAVLIKSREYLKPEGYIFLETPCTNAWDVKIFMKRYWGGWHFPRHWHLFDTKTVQLLLEQTGFEIVEKSFLLSSNFWAQSVHHFLVDHGIPEYLVKFFDCKNPLVMAFFSFIDMIQSRFGSSSNMRIIAQKI